MNARLVATTAILSLLLVAFSLLAQPSLAAAPTISRPMNLTEYTIQGDSPQTVDYSWAYDTASCEMIQNTMDTLVTFNGESTTSYLPCIATAWTGPNGGLNNNAPIQLNGTSGITTTDPISGLTFENTGQHGSYATYYWQYDFKIRTGVVFQPPYNYSLTPADVAYSFQRTMCQDRAAGPQWMLQEPLLDNAAGDNASLGGIADLTNQTQVHELGELIDHSVQYNATDVWFNIMFPGAYAPFIQILSQTWSSIESKQWIDNIVIKADSRPDWSGDWTLVATNPFQNGTNPHWTMDHTEWLDHWNPTVSPLDSPTPTEYGSGSFILTPGTPDYVSNYWSASRNVNYWGGWPASYPAQTPGGIAYTPPAGYVNTVDVSWNYPWATAKNAFLDGDCDFVAVPFAADIPELFTSPTPPYSGSNYPLKGVRDIEPLPELEVDAVFFTFNITQSVYSGTILPNDTFSQNGIPADFFGNPTWGVDVRQAFAYAFNYTAYIQEAFSGEATKPATAIIPGLAYYNASITGFSTNLAKAQALLNEVPGLNTTGFTLTLLSSPGNTAQQDACTLLQQAIQSLNPLYHVNIVNVEWGPYVTAAVHGELSCYFFGWSADFPDPQDFVQPFYHTGGMFSSWQLYSNPNMDALINAAIDTGNTTLRQNLYNQVAELALADCPSFTVDQASGRHFERDWVQGWYYNPVYSGIEFYPLWKWYYLPEANLGLGQPRGQYLTADVTYQGKVDMRSIGAVARALGSAYGPPQTAGWNFRADVNNDREIDMKDVAYVAKYFGQTSALGKWTPSP